MTTNQSIYKPSFFRIRLVFTAFCFFCFVLSASLAQATEVTISFDACGGKGLEFKTKPVSEGTAYGTLPTPYRVGYAFKGWYRTPAGTAASPPVLPTTLHGASDSTTLYAYWESVRTDMQFEIVKWNLKKKATVVWDLNKLAKLSGMTQTKKNVHSFKKYGRNWIRQYGDGLSYPLDAKVGTLTLAKAASENVVINTRSSTEVTTKIVCYKGKKIADVYSTFQIVLLKPGKKVKIGAQKMQLGKIRTFKRGKSYDAKEKSQIVVEGKMTTGLYRFLSDRQQNTHFFEYYKGMRSKRKTVGLWGASIDTKTRVIVKNKKQRLHAKQDKKNPLYKAAKKQLGKYSTSCSETAVEIVRKAKIDGPWGLLVPLGKARTGDETQEPGHVGIYLGAGKSVNGSVTSHKTTMNKAPIRDSALVKQTWYNFFRYHK